MAPIAGTRCFRLTDRVGFARALYWLMFAPHTSGVPEDPATGSASWPLGAYLVERGLVAAADTVDVVSEQGTCTG